MTPILGEQEGSNQSFRMIVHPSVGGSTVRVRMSNLYGDQDLTVTSLSVAKRAKGPAVDPATVRPLLFSGGRSVTIPQGGMVVSDPVTFPYQYGEELAVTFHLPGSTSQLTKHHDADITNYFTPQGSGDATSDTSGDAFTETTTSNLLFLGLDAEVADAQGTIVALGDSITDGGNRFRDRYQHYPHVLAARLNAADIPVGVVNAGIGGNTVVDCPVATASGWGPAAVERFDRDVLSYPNVRAVIIKEGGNDIRLCPNLTAEDVIAGLDSLIERAHAANVRVLLGTYVPRVNRALVLPVGEEQRIKINEWIRAQQGRVAAVVDFAAALDDPNNPGNQRPESGSRDGIHPGPAGLRIMAELIPLPILGSPPRDTPSPSDDASPPSSSPDGRPPHKPSTPPQSAGQAQLSATGGGGLAAVQSAGQAQLPATGGGGLAAVGALLLACTWLRRREPI